MRKKNNFTALKLNSVKFQCSKIIFFAHVNFVRALFLLRAFVLKYIIFIRVKVYNIHSC